MESLETLISKSLRELQSANPRDWQPALVAVAIETGRLDMTPDEAIAHVCFHNDRTCH